jgi:hypothetical protein
MAEVAAATTTATAMEMATAIEIMVTAMTPTLAPSALPLIAQ